MRCTLASLLVGAAIGLGVVCGTGIGGEDANCAHKCDEVKHFSERTGEDATMNLPSARGCFEILGETTNCIRLWRTHKPNALPYTDNAYVTQQYKELEHGFCTTHCYFNGGLWGKATAIATRMGEAMNITCYSECRLTVPGG